MEGGEPSERYASGVMFIISAPIRGEPSHSSSIYFEIFGQTLHAFMRFVLPLYFFSPTSAFTSLEQYVLRMERAVHTRRGEPRNPGPQKSALVD